ncbi:MAG: hypothetical protein JWL83_718 [Actinomycetia bacterium]|nr:hypothetical protein [Actinomycetes bacterium]
MVPITGVPQFERFFRDAAALDVDKSDLKRYRDFVFDKVYDMLIMGVAAAKANGRDVIEPTDLPITKGLQERIHEFKRIDEDLWLHTLLDDLAARPQLDASLSDETEAKLPFIAGGLSVALAKSFRIIDSQMKNPSSEHWKRAFRLFDLLL